MLNVRRTVYVLVAVSLSQIILISAQVRAPSRAGMLAATTFGVFSELQRATSSVVLGVRDVWFAYVALRGVREENKRLGTELTALQVRLQEQRALVRQSLGLQRLLALRAEVPLETMGARVIAADATSWFQTLAIDRGARDGVRPDMAVIAPEGRRGADRRAAERERCEGAATDRSQRGGWRNDRAVAGGRRGNWWRRGTAPHGLRVEPCGRDG